METIVKMLNSPVAQAMGWTLIHSLWQGALCYLLSIALLRSISSKHSEARYVASVAVMAIMLISSAITFAVVYSPIPAETSQATVAAIPAAYNQTVANTTNPSAFQIILSQLNVIAGQQMGVVSAVWLIGALVFLLRIISG